ncbi:hypothetical protein CDD81_1216 [Ophiocordyceps australis]|uniref:Uncharacterized protein n=1 Tax=Ophiocordyceps australis TaxID=1399860 RepID=A0A2C5YAW9_9HYPO|nr:hypothetical protein CDD81_1216 [Ophiocordyceps australis]
MLTVEPGRLRQLTAASIILLSMWEARTHIRKLYGMGTSRHDSKAKVAAKDLNKAPTKVQGVHGDKFWEEMTGIMKGLEDEHKMAQSCRALVELMNVDKEFKVPDDDTEMAVDGNATPSDAGEDEDAPERGRKRKSAATPGGRKKRARSSSQPRKRGRPRKQAMTAMDEAEMEEDWE